MHEKRGNFCISLLKIAEKKGKTDQKLIHAAEGDAYSLKLIRARQRLALAKVGFPPLFL